MNETAERVAARVDANLVGFDPATILVILSAVLPLIAQCFSRNDEPDPEQVNAAVRRSHERNPDSLLRRTARRIRYEADEPMTKSAAIEMARAVIAEACESSPESVAAFVRSVAV